MCAAPSTSTTAFTNALELQQRPVIDSMLQSILFPPKKLIIWLKLNNSQEMTPLSSLRSNYGLPFKIRVPFFQRRSRISLLSEFKYIGYNKRCRLLGLFARMHVHIHHDSEETENCTLGGKTTLKQCFSYYNLITTR